MRKWLDMWYRLDDSLKGPLFKLRNSAEHCCKAKSQSIDSHMNQGQRRVSPNLGSAGWLTCFKKQRGMKNVKHL